MARKKTVDFYAMLEDDFEKFYIKTDKEDNDTITAISTGSISLDVSTGIGGIPISRFTEVYGAKGSGKTALALNICKHAIIDDSKPVLYVDSEQAVDASLAENRIGDAIYDPEKFVHMQPELMEDALMICEMGIKSKLFGLIVLDSIGALAPKKVKEDELTDDHYALLARRMTVFLQRNAFAVRYNDVAFLGVNQIRDKIGGYSKEYGTPGGHAWKHITSLRIMLSRMGVIKHGDDKVGIESKFVIKDNKLAPPYRSYNFPIMFDSGMDELADVINFASMVGVIKRGGPFYKFEGETLGNGLVETTKTLKEDESTLDKIKELCYNVLKSEKEEEVMNA
jgi:recombination protein RecA